MNEVEHMSEQGDEVELSEQVLGRIRKRVLVAEKEKLNLKSPMGVRQDIERIIREEVE